MKKTGLRIFLTLILVAVFVIGSVSTVNAAKPEPYKLISPPTTAPYIEGTVNPSADFSFNNIGGHGLRFRWYHKSISGGGAFVALHAPEEVWFDKHSRSGLYAIDCPVPVTVAEGDQLRVDVYIIRKNGSVPRGGSATATWNVTSD